MRAGGGRRGASPKTAPDGKGFRIVGVAWNPEGRFVVRHEARAGYYYVIYHGPNLDSINDPGKVACAVLVRRRTAAPNEWLAARLAMGHASYVSALVNP